MFKKRDPYSYTKYCSLFNGANQVGTAILEYSVTHYDDVQMNSLASVVKPNVRKYLLTCSQRVIIFNPSGLNLSPGTVLASYDNYPVMINSNIEIAPDTGLDFELIDYSPQTINTKVQASGTTGDENGKTNTSSSSNTVGSSISQSNSYGASVSIGINELSDSGSVNYEHTTTTTQENSSTSGTEASSSQSSNSSNSASMSVKDWGAYALVNPLLASPSWTFGQEYPWDAITCRKTTGTPNPNNPAQTDIVAPSAMLVRLYDGISLYPPSQLSMFGINFVMKASWLVSIDDGRADDIDLTHALFYFSGSHCAPPQGATLPVIYMDAKPSSLSVGDSESLTTSINLMTMALDPLMTRGKQAIIGFLPKRFTIAPVPASGDTQAVPFKICSSSNNLFILDTTSYPSGDSGLGFTASETALSAAFSSSNTPLQITVYFKIIDTINEYTLYLKHWKTGSVGIKLSLMINGDEDAVITKYVDSLEAEGGENNLLGIDLRSQDYSSVDFHDYLQLGLNSIQITIEQIGGAYAAGSGYQLRAISIEQG